MNELSRDSATNRILSYLDDRSSNNKGQIEVPVVDERFLSSNFDFVVKSNFSTLRDAVDAEKKVFDQIKTIQTGLLRGVPLSGISPSEMENIQSVARNQLLENLQNIAQNDPNSIEGLKQKIDELQNIIDSQNQELADWGTQEVKWQETMNLWANEYLEQQVRADAFERINTELSAQQEQILTDLSTRLETDKIRTENILNALSERTNETLTALAEDVDSLKNFKSNFIDENEIGLSRMSKLIEADYFANDTGEEEPQDEEG
jgi:predicted transcriptional regulator